MRYSVSVVGLIESEGDPGDVARPVEAENDLKKTKDDDAPHTSFYYDDDA